MKWDDGLTLNDKHHLVFKFNKEIDKAKANFFTKEEREYMGETEVIDNKHPLAPTLSVDTRLKGSMDFTTTLSLVLYAGNKTDKYMEAFFELKYNLKPVRYPVHVKVIDDTGATVSLMNLTNDNLYLKLIWTETALFHFLRVHGISQPLRQWKLFLLPILRYFTADVLKRAIIR